MPRKRERIYKRGRPFAGEHKSSELEEGLYHEFNRLETTTDNLDKDLGAAEDNISTLQTDVATKASAQHDGSQKTSLGETFSPGASTWADLPGQGGSGTVSKTITTSGGRVKASLVVNLFSNNNNDDFRIRIKEDTTGGNVEGRVSTPNANTRFSIAVHEIFSPAAGSHTYTAQGFTDVAANEANIDMVDLTVTEID